MARILAFLAVAIIFTSHFSVNAFSVDGAAKHVAVVAPKAFHQSLEPWIRYRSTQGYSVHLIVPTDNGIDATPETIKQKLRNLAARVPINALLLVGVARRGEGQKGPMIPAPLFPCQLIQHYGKEKQFASDDWYADLDDDGLPDFPSGRFAVAGSAELDTLIRKTMVYEMGTTPGDWCRQLQIVAGLANFSPLLDGVLDSATRFVLTKSIPSSWDISLLYADWRRPFCPSLIDIQTELAATLQRGSLFWVYIGHGLPRMLAQVEMPWGNMEMLHADRLPEFPEGTARTVAVFLCCYVGMLDAPTRCLAEELVLAPNGPVAVVAASRVTMPYGSSVFSVEIIQQLVGQGDSQLVPRTLGAAVHQAKVRMLASTESEGRVSQKERGASQRSVRDHLTGVAGMFDPFPTRLRDQLAEQAALVYLFGDPLLVLPAPKVISLQCPDQVAPGDSLMIECTLAGDILPEKILLELVIPTHRIPLTSTRRAKQKRDTKNLFEKNRQADNEEYNKANNHVLLSGDVKLRDGRFLLQWHLPDDLRGEYLVRALACSNSDYFLGTKTIIVQRKKNER